MKKINIFLIICLLYFLFFIINVFFDSNITDYFVFGTIILVIFVISSFVCKVSEKFNKEYGQLRKGYILAVKDHYFYGSIDIFVDGKVYTIGHIEKNDIYAKLFEMFYDRYSLKSTSLLLNGIPIDVYVYGNSVSPVLKSVNMEKM